MEFKVPGDRPGEFHVLRVELEASRTTLLKALSTKHKAIEDAVEEAISKTDPEQLVAKIVRDKLPLILENAIENRLRAMVDSVTRSPEVADKMREAVRQSILRKFGETNGQDND